MVAYAGVLGRHFLENKVKLSLERQKAAGILLSVVESEGFVIVLVLLRQFPLSQPSESDCLHVLSQHNVITVIKHRSRYETEP